MSEYVRERKRERERERDGRKQTVTENERERKERQNGKQTIQLKLHTFSRRSFKAFSQIHFVILLVKTMKG